MTAPSLGPEDHLPDWPLRRDVGIGIVGSGFIVRDCHLVAYRAAGFRVVGITSRTRARAVEVAASRGVPCVFDSLAAMLDDPAIEILDVAVPPAAQPGVIREVLAHRGKVRGILAQKPLADSLAEAATLVAACERAGVRLQVNQNMRYDHSVRALRRLVGRGVLGDPVLATIEMRAIPHWMPWARGGRSLSTFIMSIHHLDTFRYWLGDPDRVLASSRPDPRADFPHQDGINLYILEYGSGARASAWDDVWTGPAREGSGADLSIRWRFEGTDGLAVGTIGWPGWPARVPSTIDYSTRADGGAWHRPRWPQAWFPDAFAGTMAGLLRAVEAGADPDISGRDNLKTLALCEAVLAAARDHRVVQLEEFAEGTG
ncbi:1,5-anhydro-D-fructose reductase [Aquisphaera giovannonii]|uniref:1,5-anhydro-D-fructose reductase n=1 Tax=Aquisphaera giovannonii TaxID=406548 RepID=A0A5B9VZE1_9BACT|nr:Gfo/Idh/MocA family oxidoreductase [Aquisphaera giovannonii]QEH33693.1 1,5-anhydro-D-fructose reductase [Aquisphaera giovannonii]